MPQILTKRVKLKDSGADAVVNASDFNSEIHEEREPLTEDELVTQLRKASNLAEVAFIERQEAARPLAERRQAVVAAAFDRRQAFGGAPRVLGQPEEMVPYLAPASHNRNAEADARGSAMKPLLAPAVPVDPVAGAKTEVELDALAASVEARREALRAERAGVHKDLATRVTQSNVRAANDLIDEANLEELDAIEKAEEDGPNRTGVLTAIQKRREILKG